MARGGETVHQEDILQATSIRRSGAPIICTTAFISGAPSAMACTAPADSGGKGCAIQKSPFEAQVLVELSDSACTVTTAISSFHA